MVYDKEFNTFCENIRTYRTKNKLSKVAMAKQLHVDVRSLCAIEEGRIPPRISVAVFFADLCNVPVSAIFRTIQM